MKKDILNMLREFGVKTEDELQEKLIKESKTITCIVCREEFQYSKIHFIDGDPYCDKHYDQLKEDDYYNGHYRG